MKIKKWLITAVVLMGMTAALLPGISASAASVPTDGTGTVIENTSADSTSREFFTIKTPDGNVFYIVVDKTKTDDNVYLLTPVTEDRLKALAESAAQKNGTTAASGTSNILGSLSGSAGTSSASGTTTVSETGGASAPGSTATAQTAKTAASAGNIAFIVLAAIGVFAAAFYFKIYKPRHTAMPESLEEEPDEGDSGDSNEGDEDDEPEETEKPRKSDPARGTPTETDQSAPEQARSELAQPGSKREPSGDQPEMEEPEPAAQEPRAPASPRPRREDVWPENEDGISRPEAQPEPTRSVQASARARVGGLFAPDTPDTPEQENPPQTYATDGTEEPEEPEPEDDENEMDYGDGMDAFGNPDEEE